MLATWVEPAAKRAYKELEKELITDLRSGAVTATNALTRLLRLQQLTSSAAVIDDQPDEKGRILRQEIEVDTSKAEALKDLLEGTDEPVVVFCVFRYDLATVAKLGGDEVAELSGRCDELAEWKAGRKRILAVQIASGSEGIDLTRARYSIYTSTGFNLGTYLQSEKRVHRPGQTKPVTYYHIVARDTVDEKVLGALRSRRSVVDAILASIPQATTTKD